MSHRRAEVVFVALLCLFTAAAYGQSSCPTPVITQIAGTNPSCGAQSITLDAGAGWASYQWSNGATTRTISDTPSATATYTVTATDALGCSATSVPYQVTVVPAPETPVIHLAEANVCAGGYGTASVDPPSNGTSWASFSWTLSHATINGSSTLSGVSFNADSSGLPVGLSVTVTDANGCPATATASLSARTIAAPVIHLGQPSICPGNSGSAYIDSPEPVDGQPNSWVNATWTIDHGTIIFQSATSVGFYTDPDGHPSTITVTATDSYGCTNSASATTAVRTVAPPVIHLGQPSICPGNSGSAYIDSPEPDGGPNGWVNATWTIDHGTIIYQSATSVGFYTDPDGHPSTITVTATDYYGCINSASVTTAVRHVAPPVIHLGQPSICPGNSGSAYIDSPEPDGGPNGWVNATWTIDHGTIVYQSATSVGFYTDPDGHPSTLTVTATDYYGCINSASVTTVVRSVAPPVIHLGQPSICPGNSGSAYIDSPEPDGQPNGWVNATWTIDHGTIIYQSATSVGFTTDPSGLPATITVTATDYYGCINSASATTTVRSVAPPVMHLGQASYCPGSSGSVYIDSPAPDGQPNGWVNATWTIDHGTIIFQSSTSAGFMTDPTGLPATLTVTATDYYGCINSASIILPVNVLTPPAITTESPDVCPTSEVHAMVAPPDSFANWSSIAWTVTNARITSSSTNSSDIMAMATGEGPVTLTVSLTDTNGCSVTSTKTVPLTTNPPTAVFSAPQSVCAGTRFSVTATDPNNPNRYYSFASPNATLVSIEGCCTGVFDAGAAGTTIDVYVTSASTGTARCDSWGHVAVPVVDPPNATITASGSTALCPGGSVTLSASSGTSWQWSNGATTQSITVNQPGSYAVTVSNGGCAATSMPTSVTSVSTTTPTISAGGPTTFCAGGSVTLTSSAGASYLWSNGATTQSITVSAGGSYSVTVTDANGCSAQSAATNVTVNTIARPTVSPWSSTTFCPGGSVQLGATSGYVSYLWSNGATTNPITVNTSGSWTVTVTDANGCTSTSLPVTTTVSQPQPPPVQAPATACPDFFFRATVTPPPAGSWRQLSWGATNITDSHSIDSYTVDFKPAANASQVVVTFTMIDWNGCQNSSQATVQIVRPPVPNMNWSGGFCPGGTAHASVTNGPYSTYAWYAYNATIVGASNGPSVDFNVNSNATYVDLTVVVTDATGCSNQWTQRLGVSSPTPFIEFTTLAFCPGGSVTLSATDGFAAYHWSNGATTRTINVSTPGTYTVTVTDSNGCSGTSAPKTVTQRTVQTPTITPSGPTTFCNGYSVQLQANSTTAVSYRWSTGATSTSIYASQTGDYTVTITDFNGCTATSAPTHVQVNPNPIATITPSGYQYLCEGSTATLRAGPDGMNYRWSTGATTQTIDVSTPGVYYSVVVTDPVTGCSTQSPDVIFTQWANPVPVVTTSGPTTFCPGGSVTLTAPASQGSYLWSNGATTRSITVNTGGTYTVTVTNGPASCTNTSAPVVVTVDNPSTPTITASGPTAFCAGGSVTLTASSGASYLWSNGATTQSITASASGNYHVTVTDANGCGATSADTAVTVNALPTPTITPSGPTTFCAGGSVTLTASSGASFLWSNGATTQSIAVSSGGNYTVTVTDANGCSATASQTVAVNPLPTATISASGPTTFCAGGSVTLTASSASSYLWSTGATTQSIAVSSGGNYTVTVTDANGCSAQSAATTVTVNPLPTPAVSPAGTVAICSGTTTTLTATAGSSYLWSNGATTQSISVGSAGDYSVTVTDANGCSAQSAATTVTVNPLPVIVSFDSGNNVCQGVEAATEIQPIAGVTYAWTFGGNGHITQNAGHRCYFIVDSGTATLTVTVTDANGCSASKTKTFTAFAPVTPTISPAGTVAVCSGTTTTLTASAGLRYAWSDGETTQSITVGGGTYSVTVTDANGCSAQSAPTTVNVNPLPTPTISPAGTVAICSGTTTTLTASGASQYHWSNGATTQSIAVGAGTYSVTVTDSNGCSAQSAATTVAQNARPTAAVGGGGSYCAGGGSATINATLTGTAPFSITWSDGFNQNVASGNTASRTVSPSSTTTYTINSISDANCSGSASGSATVTVKPLPTAAVSGGATFCAGGSTTINAALTGTAPFAITWSDGFNQNVASGSTASRTVSPTSTTTYAIISITDANCSGSATGSATVTVNKVPSFAQPANQTIPKNTSATLTVSASGTSPFTYQWYKGSFPSTSTPVGTNAPSYTTPSLTKGTYTYWVKVTNTCGSTSSATITITSN